MTLPALKESHKIYIMSALLIGASYLTHMPGSGTTKDENKLVAING